MMITDGRALQLELLLQEGDRGLIQVDDRGRACEQDGYEEEDADEPAHAAHAVEHAGERDEHQAGAAVDSSPPEVAIAGMITNIATSAASVSKTATLRAEDEISTSLPR